MAKKNTKSKTPAKRYTPRQTRKFQLRRDHPIDAHVSEILDYSRTKRREVTIIRDGVRLLWALENNDMSVLFEMFPHLKDQFIPGGLNLIEQIREIVSHAPIMLPEPEPERAGQPAGFKTLNAPTFALPIFDDDEELPTLITTKTLANDAGANFLGGIMGLQ